MYYEDNFSVVGWKKKEGEKAVRAGPGKYSLYQTFQAINLALPYLQGCIAQHGIYNLC
jgi:hypothetical protein